MSAVYIEPASKGFAVFRNGKRTKWKLSIESMVPIKKRNKLEHYYILIKSNDKVIDRAYFTDDGEVWLVYSGADIPNYIRDLAVDILSRGDMNDYISGEKVSNKFTELGLAKADAMAK